MQTDTVSHKLEESALSAMAVAWHLLLRVGIVVVASLWASLLRLPAPFTGSLSERKSWHSSGLVYCSFTVGNRRLQVAVLFRPALISYFALSNPNGLVFFDVLN